MKKVKIITATLLIILITMVAFYGIYVQVQNRMENKVKDYSYAMDIDGTRVVRLKVDTSTKDVIKDKDGNIIESATDEEIEQNGYTKEQIPVNGEDILNVDNYKTTKKLIEKRLKELNVQNYIVKVDEGAGDIVIELTENDDTDSIVSDINTVGKFEIIDADTEEVLMDNSDIKLSNVLYNTTTTGTAVYLNIEFTKDGAKKLENISSTYIETTETTTTDENTEISENDAESEDASEDNTTTTEKKITMKIDDEEIMSTSFDETIKTGKMQLSVGQASTDKDIVNDYVEKAKTIATILDTGKLPINYTIDENKYVKSDITIDNLKVLEIATAVVVVVALIILIIKYKTNGFLGAISYVGLASILLLVIRYANVILSIEGIFGILLILVLNYIFTFKLLSNIKKNKEVKKTTNQTLGKFFIKIIPVCILTIAFCFIKWIPISSFGMVMFWGLALIAIYNILITKNLLVISEKK